MGGRGRGLLNYLLHKKMLIVLMLFFLILASQLEASTNILQHSSFEVPGNNHWGFTGSKFDESNFSADHVHGSYSLKWPYTNPFKDWPYSNPYTGVHNYSLYYHPVSAISGDPYTLSVWAKKDIDSNNASIILKILDSDRSNPGLIASQTFTLSTEWKRYSLSTILPVTKNGKYVIRIDFSGVPPWQDPYPATSPTHGLVDAVQFEKGELSEYNTTTPVEFGLYPLAEANAFNWGDDVIIDLYATNTSVNEFNDKVQITIEDYFGKTISNKSVSVAVQPGQRIKQTLAFGNQLRGHFRVLITYNGEVLTEKVFSTIPPSKNIPASESIFGADASLSDFMLRLEQRVGIKWIRPHAEFGWSNIEKSKGTFSFPDYRVNLAKKYGMQLYGFLYRFPEWADTNKDGMPDNIDDWKNYVFRIVDHYKNDIKYWEILNEPCQDHLPSDKYLAIVKAAYTAAKEADPEAKLFGYGPRTCYQDIEAELSQYFDLVSDHIYPNLYGVDGKVLLDAIESRAQVLGKRWELWNTEGGASGGPTFYRTKGDYDSKDSRHGQALVNVKQWIQQKAAKSKLFYYWFQFPTTGLDHTPSYSFSWTLNEYDSSLKASAVGTAVAAHYLDGVNVVFEKVIYDGKPSNKFLTMYHFVQNNKNLLVVWVDQSGLKVEIKNVSLPTPVKFYDFFGKLLATYNKGEALNYIVDQAPVYVEVTDYNPSLINSNYFQIGLVSTPNSIIIKENITRDTPTVKVDVFGSDNPQPSSEELLFSKTVNNNSQITYIWDAPVHKSDANTILLFHFDKRSEYGENDILVHDYSGNGRHGDIYGLEYGNGYGKFGGGLKGDGSFSDKKVQIRNDPVFNGLRQFTIEMWAKLDGNYNVRLFSKGSVNSFNPGKVSFIGRLRETGSEIKFQVSDGSTVRERTGKSFPRGDGLYHHLAFVFDGTPSAQELRRLDIYLDGQLINGNLSGNLDGKCPNSQAGPNPACPIPDSTETANTEDIYIAGYKGTGSTSLFNGTMDEFVMYDRALSNTEIYEHAHIRANTTYYWFVRTSGQKIQDSSVRSQRVADVDTKLPMPPHNLREIMQ